MNYTGVSPPQSQTTPALAVICSNPTLDLWLPSNRLLKTFSHLRKS